jgi:GntR family transcriptional regulator, transcriptional repressor for pyruvate dehydrogenase complex
MATRRRPSARLVAIVDITIAEHLAIHEAILNGSPVKARRAMERHIINAAKRVGLTLSSNE